MNVQLFKCLNNKPIHAYDVLVDIAFNPVDDSDSEDEFDSDMDQTGLSDTESIGSSFADDYSVSSSKKEKRYFWQYNTQSKGPKGKRLCKVSCV